MNMQPSNKMGNGACSVLIKVAAVFLVIAHLSGCMMIDLDYPDYCDVLFEHKAIAKKEWLMMYNLKGQLQISGCGLIYSRPTDQFPADILLYDIDIDWVALTSALNSSSDGVVIYAAAYLITHKIKQGDEAFGRPETLSALRASIDRMESGFLKNEVVSISAPLW